MQKTATKPTRRAYVNPLPGYGEAEQRADIHKFFDKIDEWYVESRDIHRQHFIDHLRPGDTAVVARMGCLAKATGRIDSRMADLFEARGDIHAKGCMVVDAAGLLSKGDWPAAKAAARNFLLAQRSIINGSAKRLNFTNIQIRAMLRIQESPRYKNDNERQAAMEKEGIKPVPKRTWRLVKLPIIARERGIEL